MTAPHPSRWRIRFSSKNEVGFVAAGSTPGRVESSDAWAKRFDSREAAVAYVIRYIDATIVGSMGELSADGPTCYIEELP